MPDNPSYIPGISVSVPSVAQVSTVLQGQQGIQGSQGIQGLVGPTGPTGLQGEPGSSTYAIASASVTGVASFGNEFVVSNAGAVSLTANC